MGGMDQQAIQRLLQFSGGVQPATAPAAIPPAIAPSQPVLGGVAPVPTNQQRFSADDIRKLYTDPKKLADVDRALKNVKTDTPGMYTLDKLTSLSNKWMTERSRNAWQNALSGLGSGKVGPGGDLPGYVPGNPNPEPTPPAPFTPTPGTLSAPWMNLAAVDPIFQMMLTNAGYGLPSAQGKGSNNLLNPLMMPAMQQLAPMFGFGGQIPQWGR